MQKDNNRLHQFNINSKRWPLIVAFSVMLSVSALASDLPDEADAIEQMEEIVEDDTVINEIEYTTENSSESGTTTSNSLDVASLIEEISESIEKEGSDVNPELEYRDTIKSPYTTNAALIEAQNISHRKESSDFRFVQTDLYLKGILKKGSLVYDEKSESGTVVGTAVESSDINILENLADGWEYVESGKVRGFVKSSDVISGDLALQMSARDNGYNEVVAVINPCDNKALRYLNTTGNQVLANIVYGIAKNGAYIKESKSDDARDIGHLNENGIAYVLQDDRDGYLYVESGDVRGFVKSSEIQYGADVAKLCIGREDSALAEEYIKPENNKALYYTLASVQEFNSGGRTRQQMVDFACQFVGNPYVWGGTSLTNGADCSGFVQSVYAHFGYTLPRVACDQAVCSIQIPVSEALPGDLVFYADSGYVYHVAMYIGDGMTVQAKSSRDGIVITPLSGSEVWAVSIL